MKAAPRDTNQPVAVTTATAEDEAVKRNTDCVYFLASPLTCKKGSECEYRHSEEARINPRDCWFWLNRSCLNPKCPFRHPPLDGLSVSATATNSAKLSLPPQPAASAQVVAANAYAYNSGKQATPCYYFQKGHCLKGDRCPFMHIPQPQTVDNAVPQPPAQKPWSVTEPQNPKKDFGNPKILTQFTKLPQTNVVKPPVQVAPPTKLPTKAEIALVENGRSVESVLPRPTSIDDDIPRYKQSSAPLITSGNSLTRPQRVRQTQPLDDRNFRNGKEPDEFLRESSPGFDVLVDDELEEADYYQNEDKFGRVVGHDGGRHLNALNEFEYVPSDYNSVSKFDRENLNDKRGGPAGYELYGRAKDQYGWEQRRASSERAAGGTSLPERRGFTRGESPDQVDGSDLRHRLSKHRRISESRSVASSDRRGDVYRREDRGSHVEDQRYRSHSRRNLNNSLLHDGSRSNRLQGRLSNFGRSSPETNHNESYSGKEADRGRNWGRLSPGRPLSSSYQGRLQDRLMRRVQEDFTTEGRSLRGSAQDDLENNSADFAGPKSLAELKGSKVSLSGEEQQPERTPREPKNMRVGKLGGLQESESSLSFEGPKPLSEILKRKREEKAAASGNGLAFSVVEQISQKEQVENEKNAEEADHQPLNDESGLIHENATSETANEDQTGLIPEEGNLVAEDVGPSEIKSGDHDETEEMAMLDKEEDQELETFEQRDDEYDYEQVDGENAEVEEEYMDDEDGDDFEKRIGVMFS